MSLFKDRNSCDSCYGSGKDYEDESVSCHRCMGTGRSLTEVGRELILFLRDHYGLKVQRD